MMRVWAKDVRKEREKRPAKIIRSISVLFASNVVGAAQRAG
jgi:hypothetical protein